MSLQRAAARRYVDGTIAGTALAVLAVLFRHPVRPGIPLLVFALLGAAFASRSVRIGRRIDMSIAHPFIFAAWILEGPSAGLVVSLATILGAALLRAERMAPRHLLFNLSVVCAGTLGSWATCRAALGPAPPPGLEASVLPVLAGSLVFYVLNTALVVGAVSLDHRLSFFRTWHDNALWSAPSFLGGGVLGLLIARLLDRWGGLSVLLALPFCWLIHLSYRMYLDRLQAEKQRLELVELHNAELESKVKERTRELVALNEQLRASNSSLAEANRLKNAFLANMSHELRTPLNAVIGFSELLQRPAVDSFDGDTRDEFASEIQRAGTSLLGLINGILDLAKIEAGRTELHLGRCDAVEVARQAISMCRVLAARKELRLELRASAPLRLRADARRLKQILWNLVSNAIKFTPAGGRVEVEVLRQGSSAVLRVRDTGIGIEPADQERVFEDFYQVDGSLSRNEGGTGLGLALTRKFVALHGGTITLESQPGRGSCFEVRLPAAPRGVRTRQGEVDRAGAPEPAVAPPGAEPAVPAAPCPATAQEVRP